MKIDNKILKYLFEKFDFLIRFTYSKLSINKLVFWKLYSSDFKNLDIKFEEMKNLLVSNKYYLKNKTCLELGPGNSYINAYNFLLNGAKKTILVDKFPRIIKNKKQKKYFRKEIYFIKKKFSLNNVFFMNKFKIDKQFLKIIPKDISEIKFDEKVDFIYSISVFEHIKSVEKNIEKMSNIIQKGGFMYHHIDMRDHYNFSNPFLFLKYKKSTWEKYLTKEGVSYTNRIRYYEFKQLFEKYGFEIIGGETKRFPINLDKVSDEFNKADETINIGLWDVLLRKK